MAGTQQLNPRFHAETPDEHEKVHGVVCRCIPGEASPVSVAGPLSGKRFAVKDLFDLNGLPTSAGNPDWAATHSVPQRTASAVADLVAAGASIVAKTVTDELAYSLNGANMHFGVPRNPRAPERLAGGSSSGSASCAAAGLADVGLGTDTGGSIRVPASYCGLYGLRTTHGCIAMDGVQPLAPSFDTIGWMARSLSDMGSVADVLLPKSEVASEFALRRLIELKPDDDDVGSLWSGDHDIMARDLESAFEHVVKTVVPADFFRTASAAFRTLQGAEIWAVYGEWIQQHTPVIAPDIYERLLWCSRIDADQIAQAREQADLVRQQVRHWMRKDNTFLLLPTTPGPAPRVDAGDEWLKPYREQLMGLTALAGLCGLPQLHMPMGDFDDAPIGLSLIAPAGQDRLMIQLAAEQL